MSNSVITCSECRRAMRLWALCARRPEFADRRDVCLTAAKTFRDGPCMHFWIQRQRKEAA